MKFELMRVAPLRTANIAGLVYGIVTAVVAIILLPFCLVLLLATTRMNGSDAAASVLPLFLIVFYPLIGAVMGWIMGLVGSAVYNLIVRWTGGLLLEFADRSAAQS